MNKPILPASPSSHAPFLVSSWQALPVSLFQYTNVNRKPKLDMVLPMQPCQYWTCRHCHFPQPHGYTLAIHTAIQAFVAARVFCWLVFSLLSTRIFVLNLRLSIKMFHIIVTEKNRWLQFWLRHKTEITIIYRIIKRQVFQTITHQELAPHNWNIWFDRRGNSGMDQNDTLGNSTIALFASSVKRKYCPPKSNWIQHIHVWHLNGS